MMFRSSVTVVRSAGIRRGRFRRAHVILVALALAASLVPERAAAQIEMTIDASKAGPKIDRQIFGQFAEHLGKGIYEGVWVGPGAPIRTHAAFATTSWRP